MRKNVEFLPSRSACQSQYSLSLDKKSLEDNFLYEQFYWWFLGRRKIVRNLIAKFFERTDNSLALDIGCGTGIVMNDLKKYANPIGMDVSEIAISFAKTRRHQNLLCGDACNLPFRNEVLDLIIILGVLSNEDVESDDAAIMESYRVLKPGGVIIIDEAAYSSLQSKHNISVSGVRRYTRNQLVNRCTKYGFKILKASYWNTLMLPVFFLIAKLEIYFFKEKQYSRLSSIPKFVNYMLKFYLYIEAFLLKYINFPFGPSVVIVAKK